MTAMTTVSASRANMYQRPKAATTKSTPLNGFTPDVIRVLQRAPDTVADGHRLYSVRNDRRRACERLDPNQFLMPGTDEPGQDTIFQLHGHSAGRLQRDDSVRGETAARRGRIRRRLRGVRP